MVSIIKRNNPLLLPAIKNAFSMLVPGGELLIDHCPYTTYMSKSMDRALCELDENPELKKHILRSFCEKRKIREDLTIVSILQEEDAFTNYVSYDELSKINNYINREYLGKSFFMDPEIDYEAINMSIEALSSIFTKSKKEIIDGITNDIGRAITEWREKDVPIFQNGSTYYCIFELFYYMHSRRHLIQASLESIGFQLDENFLQYFPVNPYNNRKHAWIIKAKKPVH